MTKARLRVGVIGTGRWGRNLVRVFGSLEQAELLTVCDLDPVTLAGLTTHAERVTDYRRILDDKRIDAVVIATPPHTHADLAVASFEAGKHVFVEKPMALCSADAWRVVRAAEKAGKRGMVGYVMLHHPAIQQLKRWIDDGVLGEVRRIVSVRRGPPGGPHEPGPWWSLAPHDVSLTCYFFDSEPESIALSGLPESDADEANARLDFTDGRIAELTVSVGKLGKIRQLAVHGSRATALFDDVILTNQLRLHSGATQPFARAPSFEPLHLQAKHFVAAVLMDHAFLLTVQQAARLVDVLAFAFAPVGPLSEPFSERKTA